jgi:hypothetical protein
MKSDNQTTGRGIKHPNHRMHRNSLEAYAMQCVHLKRKEAILEFLSKNPERLFSRRELCEIFKKQHHEFTHPLKTLKDKDLVLVECKVDPGGKSPIPVEHYGHKKEKAQQMGLFGAN